MANGIKYQAHEVLNKVLNSGEDALNVDIDNVTLTTEGGDVAIDVALDKANDSVTIYANTAADGSGDSTVPLVDAAGNLQIDIVSSALPSGGATAANQATIIGHVDGVETLITSTNTKLDTLETTNNANQVLLGTIDSDTDAIKTAVQILDNAISGSEMQVDVVAALPAGSNTIGVVDLGSTDNAVLDAIDAVLDTIKVDTEEIEGAVETIETAIKAEDAAHSDGDTGIMALVVRNDVLEALAGSDGDYSALQVNKTGALNVTETVGHLGAHYESSTTANSGLKIVAIQFLEDTKFSVLTPATSAYIGNTGSGGDDIAAGDVFPQGMTIFGRWTAFTLVSGGRVIAYNGDW